VGGVGIGRGEGESGQQAYIAFPQCPFVDEGLPILSWWKNKKVGRRHNGENPQKKQTRIYLSGRGVQRRKGFKE